MDFWAPIAGAVVAPLWAAWERSPYLRHHRELLRTQYLDPQTARQRQWESLTRQLAHAYDNTTLWRSRLERLGLTPGDIRRPEDFRRVPALEKAQVRDELEGLLARGFERRDLVRHTTSGSTGVSLVVYLDEPARQFKRACTLRADEWSGWRLGQRVARAWGNPPRRGWRGLLRNVLLEREIYLDTLKMTEEDLEAFARRLERFRPSLLFGHAHSLYLLAEYLGARGGPRFQIRAIISTAMVLHAHERRAIERVFGCPVTNRYGCEEVGLIASECERREGLHINTDALYVEVVRPDGSPAAAGEPGALLVSDLLNRAMPLLRYRVGDVAVRSGRDCACGRSQPLIERLEGRVADYVVTPAGEWVSGISLTENFAVKIPGIHQLQIVQESLHRLVFRIVRGPRFEEDGARRIGELVRERFGASVHFDCEFVDRIPQEASGKYRFCISKVPNPFTTGAHVTPGERR